MLQEETRHQLLKQKELEQLESQLLHRQQELRPVRQQLEHFQSILPPREPVNQEQALKLLDQWVDQQPWFKAESTE